MVSAFDWFSTGPLLAAALAARLSRHRVLPPPVEVHWRAEPSFGDRPGITLVQADPAGGPVRDDAGDAVSGLRGDLMGLTARVQTG